MKSERLYEAKELELPILVEDTRNGDIVLVSDVYHETGTDNSYYEGTVVNSNSDTPIGFRYDGDHDELYIRDTKPFFGKVVLTN